VIPRSAASFSAEVTALRYEEGRPTSQAPQENDAIRRGRPNDPVEEVDDARGRRRRLVVHDVRARGDCVHGEDVQVVLAEGLHAAAAGDLHVDRIGPLRRELAPEGRDVVGRLLPVRREGREREDRDRLAGTVDATGMQRRDVVSERSVVGEEGPVREVRGERNRAVAEADDAQDVRAERLGDGRGAGRLAEAAEVAIRDVEEPRDRRDAGASVDRRSLWVRADDGDPVGPEHLLDAADRRERQPVAAAESGRARHAAPSREVAIEPRAVEP
jgi:hypothetical protein